MFTKSALLAIAAAPAVLAHTQFTNFYINGVSQGDGVAMRMKLDGSTATSPIPGIDSNNMACNVDGTKGVSRVQSVPDGAKLTFEFRAMPNDPSYERLDPSHKGPCAVYLKKVDDAVTDQAYGDGWFKIFDDGYDGSKWCTEKLIDNNGLFNVDLPKGLKGGYYLARPELLALHSAHEGDPQFYAGCAQIFLESNGDLVPEETVSIPGYVEVSEPGLSFNIYNNNNDAYTMPGPKVATLSSRSTAAGTNRQAQTSQTKGLRPEGCICENGNWCGVEVSSYSDEKGCWAAAEECWDQGQTCWDTAPPPTQKGCDIWQKKCERINAACKAGNFQGPPNKGQDLTPKQSSVDVGAILPTSGGGVVNSPPKTSAAEVKTSATVVPSSAKSTPTSSVGGEEAAAPSNGDEYEVAPVTPTVTVPASEKAPAPTKPVCPAGYVCVTKTKTVVATETAYTTVYADMKRRSLHARR